MPFPPEVTVVYAQWGFRDRCPTDDIQFVGIADEINGLKITDGMHGIIAIKSSRVED